MKNAISIVCALLAGFVGGLCGSRVGRPAEGRPVEAVRARRFELIDEKGSVVSLWGTDKNRGQAVLAFGGYWPEGAPERVRVQRGLSLEDPDTQRAAFGVQAEYPYLEYRAPDGKIRLSLFLSDYEKPNLMMHDETGWRLHMGVGQSDTPSKEDNNWGLEFAPDRAWIGSFVVREGGIQYVQGMFGVAKDKVKYPYDQAK